MTLTELETMPELQRPLKQQVFEGDPDSYANPGELKAAVCGFLTNAGYVTYEKETGCTIPPQAGRFHACEVPPKVNPSGTMSRKFGVEVSYFP